MPADGAGAPAPDAAERERRRADLLARRLLAAERTAAWRFCEVAHRGRDLLHVGQVAASERRRADTLEEDVQRLNADVQALLRRAEEAEAEADRFRELEQAGLRREAAAELRLAGMAAVGQGLETTLRETRDELSRARGQLALGRAERAGLEAALALATAPLAWRLRWWLAGTAASRLPRAIRRPARLLWWLATGQLPRRLALRARLRRERRVIAGSPHFDAGWYRAQHPELAPGTDAALHYLLEGARAGAAPGPGFDPAAYLLANPELRHSGENPLLHAGRKPSLASARPMQ